MMAPLMVRVSLAVWLVATLDVVRCVSVPTEDDNLKSFFTKTIECSIQEEIDVHETKPLALYLDKCGFEERFKKEVKGFVECGTLYSCLEGVSKDQNALESVLWTIHKGIPRTADECKSIPQYLWGHGVLDSAGYSGAQDVLQGYLRRNLNYCSHETNLQRAIATIKESLGGDWNRGELSSLADYLAAWLWPNGSLTKIYESGSEIAFDLENALEAVEGLSALPSLTKESDCSEWSFDTLLNSLRKCLVHGELKEFAMDHFNVYLDKCTHNSEERSAMESRLAESRKAASRKDSYWVNILKERQAKLDAQQA